MITIENLPLPKDLYKMMYHDLRFFLWKNKHQIEHNIDRAHGVMIDKLLNTTRPYIRRNQFTLETRDRLYLWAMGQFRERTSSIPMLTR